MRYTIHSVPYYWAYGGGISHWRVKGPGHDSLHTTHQEALQLCKKLNAEDKTLCFAAAIASGDYSQFIQLLEQ